MANEGYSLGMSGGRVRELLLRHFIVPTLESVPNATTESWLDGNNTVMFRVGEMCRVMIDGKYVFYRLNDINGNSRVWERTDSVVATEDDSIRQLTKEEYALLEEEGKVSPKTLYLVLEGGEPIEMYIGQFLIGKKGEEGDKGFPYSFPIIF